MKTQWMNNAAAFALLLLPSCTDEPPAQPPDDPPPHVQQDTTSHDVEWTVYTWGDPNKSTSAFYDVFALNDTCVWAVGDIHAEDTDKFDSLGRWITPYNIAYWNGKTWTLSSRHTKRSSGDVWYEQLRAVYAFRSDDVWFFSEMAYIHWDGSNWRTEYVRDRRGSMKRIWGRTPGDIYICGTNGSLTRYYRGIFHLMETGTDVDLSDIYGADNGDFWTGGYQYWDLKNVFLYVTNDKVSPLMRSANGKRFYGGKTIWISKDTLYADVGSGIYVQSVRDTNQWRFIHWPAIASPIGYMRGMRGSADNNIFCVGDFGSIVHYNGKSWYVYPFFSFSNNTTFYSVTVTKENVWCVGIDPQDRAVIYHGKLKQ